MDIIKIVYWISVVFLYILIAFNFWLIFRNHRTFKKWQKMINELEQIIGEYAAMRDKYIELLSEQREEVPDGARG